MIDTAGIVSLAASAKLAGLGSFGDTVYEYKWIGVGPKVMSQLDRRAEATRCPNVIPLSDRNFAVESCFILLIRPLMTALEVCCLQEVMP